MPVARRRALVLAVSLVATFVVTRAALHASPNSDFNVGAYNIHHLFTGLLIVVACGVPLVVAPNEGRLGDALTAGFGVGLSLALDEWVYLIATDGSNAAYLTRVSLVGGIVMIAATVAYIAAWGWRRPPRRG